MGFLATFILSFSFFACKYFFLLWQKNKLELETWQLIGVEGKKIGMMKGCTKVSKDVFHHADSVSLTAQLYIVPASGSLRIGNSGVPSKTQTSSGPQGVWAQGWGLEISPSACFSLLIPKVTGTATFST